MTKGVAHQNCKGSGFSELHKEWPSPHNGKEVIPQNDTGNEQNLRIGFSVKFEQNLS